MSAPPFEKKQNPLVKQKLDDWLNQVDYKELNSPSYTPSQFALIFMNFIKLVNGAQGESHKTPPVHLKMLDKMVGGRDYIANLCFRGAGKTAVFMEYLTLFIAFYGHLPEFGKIEGMIYVSDSMDNGVKSARKNIEFRYNNSEFLQKWIPKATFTDNYLEFQNAEGHRLGVKMFGAKTGLRGTKIFGKRPVFAVLDDLVSDDDAKSKAAMTAIKDTVYKGVNHALDPTRRKVVFNGTPFNTDDILIEAVESGAWDVNVWPVCEKFPCTREEFVGAWEDRFTFEFIQEQYEMAVNTGKLASFYQELMLRITSEEERLVQDAEIGWYSRADLLRNKSNFNFYITTDFATSAKQTADFSVISDWAYNSNQDWFWVDGICEKQTIDKTFNDLFKHVSMYSPQQVGIEVTGQQQAYIKLLQGEMMNRNIWFNFASSEKSGEPGIRPTQDKLSRFNMVVPWFKARKIYFPEEMRHSVIVGQFLEQIRLATSSGLKGKDDCIDTISMLAYLTPWKPSESAPVHTDSGVFEEDLEPEDISPMSSYVV
jgi:phage terminase large subunit-like protein